MVINPIVGVYIPIKRIPIKGVMTIPNIATFDRGTFGSLKKSIHFPVRSLVWMLNPRLTIRNVDIVVFHSRVRLDTPQKFNVDTKNMKNIVFFNVYISFQIWISRVSNYLKFQTPKLKHHQPGQPENTLRLSMVALRSKSYKNSSSNLMFLGHLLGQLCCSIMLGKLARDLTRVFHPKR